MGMAIPTGLWALTILIGVATTVLIVAARGRFARMPPGQKAWRVIEDWVCIFLVVGMLAAAALQVVTRYAFADSVSIVWTEEFLRLLLVWGVLWGATIVQREDDHICMSVVHDLLPERFGWMIRLAGDVIVFGCLGLIFWYGCENSANLFGIYTTSLGLPVAAFALAMPIASGLMIAFTGANFIRRLRHGARRAFWSRAER
jgi:TRAP-type C4-dicarboxylate transport system permease small subunit